jgi:16S rRNA (cytosine967-C5)-methyltransferase
MADMLIQEPPLDLTTKPGVAGPDVAGLGGEVLPGGTVRLAKAGDVRALSGYEEGNWWVQDISAALPVRLLINTLGNIKGKRVLDMCAAPGGKTLQLAAAGADVTALDKNKERLERVKENLERTGLTAKIAVGDANKWRDPENMAGGGFDIVILDAPCTATGTFRRRPDVLYNKKPEHIVSLARIQEKLLMAAARHVAPGGTLLYCTCSLQKREGEEQITKFMQNRTDFRLNSLLGTDGLGVSVIITSEGVVRILPHFMHEKGGMDGFFVASLSCG